jgi:hypothetical protein
MVSRGTPGCGGRSRVDLVGEFVLVVVAARELLGAQVGEGDEEGREGRGLFAAAHGGKDDKFAAHDGNGDGFITQAEMDAHHAQMKAGEGKCGEGKCGAKK